MKDEHLHVNMSKAYSCHLFLLTGGNNDICMQWRIMACHTSTLALGI